MKNLLKMERYYLLHNFYYWCGLIVVFTLGFLTADTYLAEVMGYSGRKAHSLADIFNGMVYDSTFLLIIISTILALIFGQDFSNRTIDLEICAGHSRKDVFVSKVIVYLITFNGMALVYPFAGCIREFSRYGIADGRMLLYNIVKAIVYSCLLNSATFLIAILICCYLQAAVKSAAVTAVATFVLSLYLAYGMKLKLPVSFLTTYQIRAVLQTTEIFWPIAILTGVIWIAGLLSVSWKNFSKCDFK